ncbi:MAG TPA: HAD family phosphatase [Candidatus Anaerostipes excrementavium]|uniref:HAD family phosphatase n=1 Tax=Candidatus Anaerostipes excrementavium TaxID=2838463 RepID=A0A9D2BB49_9FIRM|nr:HAD family phosphatase [uncultured Anaerostipes sp.]HIX68952.1 HAD family phosphatase [Candidatus Anaerostipes excrementavium]
MNFDCVVFDFNGTLFFDDDKHVAAWNQISKEIRGIGITPQELHENINGVPNQQTITFLSGGTYTQEQIDFYSQKKEAVYREKCMEDTENFHLVDGAEEYFDYLKSKNIPFTIATASIKPNVDFFIESFHLDRWIPRDHFVYDDGTYENKVAMFQDACRILGSDPDHCLVFEDSGSGIRNAYEAGCSNIIIMAGQKDFAEFEGKPGVQKIIRSFREMLSE